MTPEDARGLYSEYLGSRLDGTTEREMQAYLSESPDAAAELAEFERTLLLLHRMPRREPSLDLWREFAPKLAEYQAERKQSPARRLGMAWTRLRSEISTGVILWTHALAGHTHARFERYLLQDPLPRHLHGGPGENR